MALAGLILGYFGISIIPILIIAAIAIPNLLRAKMAANEAGAVVSLHELNSAAIEYSTIYGKFPTALSNLGPTTPGTGPSAEAADQIDSALASSTKYGYIFHYNLSQTSDPGYTIVADPVTPGTTGRRHFFTDQTDVIRADSGQSATANSPPVN
jgi:type IV pilus assembly protein PilA